MNNQALIELDRIIQAYLDLTSKKWDEHGNMPKDMVSYDLETFYGVRNLFFNLVTRELNFDEFYNRFGTPGGGPKNLPIAWGPRFWPDLISDEMWSQEDVLVRAKKIKKIYDKSIKLEKAFKKKSNKIK